MGVGFSFFRPLAIKNDDFLEKIREKMKNIVEIFRFI